MGRGNNREAAPIGGIPVRTLRLGLAFAVIALVGNVVLFQLADTAALYKFCGLTARAVTGLIKLSGINAILKNNVIYLSHSTWLVDTECTAVNLFVIFTAFILVYPAGVAAKVTGIVSGYACIFTANVIRLFAMAWVDRISPSSVSLFHDYIWQVAFLIFVVLLWMVWIDKVVKREGRKTVSP